MKSVTIKLISKAEKELFFKIILLSGLSIMGYSRLSTKNNRAESIKLTNIYRDNFGDFDKLHVPNKPPIIAKMISVLNPRFNLAERNDVAIKIYQALQKYKIAPQIVVAIIDTESNFNHELVSSTGDLSLAQVNVNVWNKEFLRMNLPTINPEKLKTDKAYSLEIMARILSILKTRYEKKDRRWYARYHSKTKKYKRNYLTKLESRMRLLQKAQVVAMK